MKIKSHSIRNQMIGLFSLLIIVPLLLSEIYVYYMLQSNIQDNYIRHQKQSMIVLSKELKAWVNKYENLSFNIFGNPEVQTFLKKDLTENNAGNLAIKYDFNKAMLTYSGYTDYIKSVYIMDTKNNIYGNKVNRKVSKYLFQKKKLAEKFGGLPVWDYSLDKNSIVLVRQINDINWNLNRKEGYLFIVIDTSELNNIFKNFVMDNGQQFLFKNDHDQFKFGTSNQDLSNLLTEKGSQWTTITDNSAYYFFQNYFDDWIITTWIPKNEIFKPIYRLVFAIIFVMTTLSLFSVIMVFFISNRITKPLRIIQNSMKRLGGGYLGLKIPVIRDDEIGELASALNSMSEKILELINRNKEEETNLRLIQLRTLQYQINPHFLYNTLDSVNMLARKENNHQVADIVTYLSRLLRIGLNQGREMISLTEEVNHVQYYLKIQKIRFGDKLQWDIQIDDNLKEVKIIKFLLQPLVENGIIHGIRKRNQAGYIHISITSDQKYILLIVEDNGIGMTAEEKERVRSSLNKKIDDNESKDGFGLKNVHQRVRLHYGKNYGICIESEMDKGTRVIIRLPYAV